MPWISLLNFLPLRLHLYARLVDDISIVAQGEISDVKKLLNIMSERYPTMPLNFQISFGYSRFLDLHVYNFLPLVPDERYALTTTLAYKDNSTFCYTPKTSNIHCGYKTAIVLISLYRAHTRCSDQADINHHIQFMKNIVKARNQDPSSVIRKYK